MVQDSFEYNMKTRQSLCKQNVGNNKNDKINNTTFKNLLRQFKFKF